MLNRWVQMILLGQVCACFCSAQLYADPSGDPIKYQNKFINNYKEYQINYAPLMQTPRLFQELIASQKKAIAGDLARGRLTRHINILESTLKKSPHWVDGLWLFSSEIFQLASSYTEEADLPLARSLLVKAERASEHCLTLEKDNPLCKLFLGSSIAKIATIDGVMASISEAERVKDLWISVSHSPFNIHFTPAISMQGAVRYALGIFYRLVPDYTAIEWMYGVRGDLEKSVQFHRESLQLDDKKLPCSNLMLGVALICLAESFNDGDREPLAEATLSEGLSFLQIASTSDPIYSVNSATCQKDSKRLMKNLDDACGYSISKQQKPMPSEKEALQHK